MDKLLERQGKLLDRLVDLLKEEREVLIREDGKRLREIVSVKERLQSDLEHTESIRKEKLGDTTLKKMIASTKGKKADRLMEIGEAIKKSMTEIRSLQETNMMLTRQSAAYSQRLMDILQQAVRRGGMTYGQDGAVSGSHGVMASVDKSV